MTASSSSRPRAGVVRLGGIVTPTFLHVYVAHFFSVISFHLMVLFPLFVTSLGGDDFQIGLLTATATGGGILLRWVTGPFWDRFPRRLLFLAGSSLTLAGFLLLAGVRDLEAGIYVARLLNGAGLGLLFGAFFTYAADIVPADRRAQGIGLFGTSGMAAAYVGVRIGERVLEGHGFSALFLTGAGIALLALALALTLPEPRRRRIAAPTATAGVGTEVVGRWRLGYRTARATPVRGPSPDAGSSQPVGYVHFLAIWGICTAFGGAVTAAFAFLAPFAAQAGLTAVAPFFLAYSLVAIVIRLLGGQLPDQIGRRRVLWPALIFFVAGLVLLPMARNSTALFLVGALGGVGHGYGFPILNAMAVDRARGERRGLHVGLFTSFVDLGGLIGGPLLGLLARAAGYAALYRVSAGLLLFLATLLLLLDLRLDPEREPSLD